MKKLILLLSTVFTIGCTTHNTEYLYSDLYGQDAPYYNVYQAESKDLEGYYPHRIDRRTDRFIRRRVNETVIFGNTYCPPIGNVSSSRSRVSSSRASGTTARSTTKPRVRTRTGRS